MPSKHSESDPPTAECPPRKILERFWAVNTLDDYSFWTNSGAVSGALTFGEQIKKKKKEKRKKNRVKHLPSVLSFMCLYLYILAGFGLPNVRHIPWAGTG